ncbi:membrane dipeptidase [Dyadobacter jejuensis]|uniref:Membrane dipeptidase n=1 Tax=Dyadobacter jejuensis TaxID=1082580 RepID=A0A316AHR0_9BACT|nr:membrane dipeptidase [Dyadobacter jejuensis]PWJ57246.1 membrane dipeptidase [Dyadobacter jejuensis]
MSRKLIIDAHLDLSMNAIEWNRNLREPVQAIRMSESGMTDKLDRGLGTVALPELRQGGIGLVVATQIARYVGPGNNLPGWNSPEIAWGITQAQLGWYRAMEEQGEMKQISNRQALDEHIARWLDDSTESTQKPIGYILSLEGADSLVNLSYLEKAYAYGLRALGPAHYGPGRYAPGTGMAGPLTPAGLDLLSEMDNLNMILDVTHLTDEGFSQALSRYKGPVWASHHNCRALVHHQRQLTDDQIKQLIERDSVIGGVLDTWMLANDWQRGKDDPKTRGVNLEKLIDHYDHICQMAGNTDHIAIGSDLDGGYGKEQSPYDLDTIADLQNLEGLLRKRGYADEDLDKIFYSNWLNFIRKAWS